MQFPSDHQVSLASVIAFLSALTTALAVIARTQDHPETSDPFLVVEREIREFFDHVPGLKNLNPEQQKDLLVVRKLFVEMRPIGAMLTNDPDLETKH